MAIKQLKTGITVGPGNVEVDFLKLLDEEGVDWITDISNRICNSENILKEWLKIVFMKQPKKPGAKRYEEYGTMNIVGHVLKVFLRIMHGRM